MQVSLLIHMNDEFSAEDFCTVIFDEFFFAGLARDNVPKHLLKLLWYIYPKLPTVRLQTLVKALQPTSQVNMKEVQVIASCLTLRIDCCFCGNRIIVYSVIMQTVQIYYGPQVKYVVSMVSHFEISYLFSSPVMID